MSFTPSEMSKKLAELRATPKPPTPISREASWLRERQAQIPEMVGRRIGSLEKSLLAEMKKDPTRNSYPLEIDNFRDAAPANIDVLVVQELKRRGWEISTPESSWHTGWITVVVPNVAQEG